MKKTEFHAQNYVTLKELEGFRGDFRVLILNIPHATELVLWRPSKAPKMDRFDGSASREITALWQPPRIVSERLTGCQKRLGPFVATRTHQLMGALKRLKHNHGTWDVNSWLELGQHKTIFFAWLVANKGDPKKAKKVGN